MKLLALSTIMTAHHIQNAIDFPPFQVPVKLYHSKQVRAALVLVPAMGMVASFYQPFAEAMADRGIAVLLAEIPGTGDSRPRPSRSLDYGYRDLVERYVPAVVDMARSQFPGVPLVLAGHSLGAQIGTLATAQGLVEPDALITVAGGHIHYRNWSGAGAAKVLFGANLFGALTYLFGHLPGQHVGFGGPQARTLIRDWSRIIRTGSFSHVADDKRFGNKAPMLCVGIEGDGFAPGKSVSALAEILGGDVEIMQQTWKGNPHSSWARYPAETVGLIENWLDKNLSSRGAIMLDHSE